MAFVSTTAVANYRCPKCGAKPGERCRTPKRRLLFHAHQERTSQLTEQERLACMVTIQEIGGRLASDDFVTDEPTA